MLKSCDLPVAPTGRNLSTAVGGRQAAPARRIACARTGRVRAGRHDSPEGRGDAATLLGARDPGTTGTGLPATSKLDQVAQVAEHGSQTTEYALLLIVAATITMLAVTWAKQGAIKGVLDGVVGQVLAMFGIGSG